MAKKSYILCITEGERLDPRIINNLKNLFISSEVKIFPICLNIYNLYVKMQDAGCFGTGFIDVFSVIQQISKEQHASYNKELLKLTRNQIGEIFLFFDYDGHDTLAPRYPQCLNDMLNLFDNETENGKLYISYPMIESYKHPIDENSLVTPINTNIHYKQYVSSICCKYLGNLSRLKRDDWIRILSQHIKSSNYVVSDSFSYPSDYSKISGINQFSIYNSQNQKYIPHNKVVVINAFANFLLEYLGEDIFKEFIKI